MKSLYCKRIKIDKNNDVLLYIIGANGNANNYNFTKKVLKKNKQACFYTILQELINRISKKEIIGFYSKKYKDNITFILQNITQQKKYKKYYTDKGQFILPLKTVKKEWDHIQNIITKKDKVYVFKNKYDNYFVSYEGNPSSEVRLTRIYTTSLLKEASKFTLLETRAMQGLFNISISGFTYYSLSKVFENIDTLIA